MSASNMVALTVRLPLDHHQVLTHKAKLADRSVSWVVRQLCADFCGTQNEVAL